MKSRAKTIKKVMELIPWINLPQDILESIHRKLCFTDQVRLREVCTSWLLSPDFNQSSYSLPWVTLYSENFSTVDNFGKLFDPNSQQVYEINFSDKYYRIDQSDDVTVMVCASKNGWILLCSHLETGFLLFLRNPFTIKVILLPQLVNFRCTAATFTTNPDSPKCEFLVLCNPYPLDNVEKLCIARFCLWKSKKWSVQYLEEDTGDYSVHYMEGELYCLGFEGMLKSYNLESRSWEFLMSCLPTIDHQDGYWSWKHGSLVENDGDLLMVCMLQTHTYKSNLYEWFG